MERYTDAATPPPPPRESDAAASVRFTLELEFVQMLANPKYLRHVAQQPYFREKAFVNYLKYLLYWKRPEYVKYITYPYALPTLDFLQEPAFRDSAAQGDWSEWFGERGRLHWLAERDGAPLVAAGMGSASGGVVKK